MQIRPRLTRKIACFCRQNYMQLSGKNTRKCRQKYPQVQTKTPASAGKNTRHCSWKHSQFQAIPLSYRRYIHQPIASKLDYILQVKLTATFVLSYVRSRVFCMWCLPCRCRLIYLFLQLTCIWGFFTSVSPFFFRTFAGKATVAKKYH